MSVAVVNDPQTQSSGVAAPRKRLALEGVNKSYGSGATQVDVLKDIDLELEDGEFVAVVGFSGSGKTTLTKLLAGLETPSVGRVLMDGKPVTAPGPERGIVFQNYSLLPWLTVRGNISLSVDAGFRSWTKSERRDHVERFIEMVGLSHAAHRRPHELSGGMRQRTSLARTLALKPQVLLLDEPLSALDALTRSVLQEEILKIWEEERQTCLMITNDVDEAILLADRIVPLTPGPSATLGQEFRVDLPRPRIKAELNQNQTFKELRNSVTNYLVDLRKKARQAEAESGNVKQISLPDLKPKSLAPPSKAILNSPV